MTWTGLAALMVGGCTVAVNGPDDTPTPAPAQPANRQPTLGAVATPVAPPTPLPVAQNGLIPSEDPDKRRDELMPGRSDPFAPPGATAMRPGEVVEIPPPPFDIAPPPGPLPQVQNAPLPPFDPSASTLADFPGQGADIANMIIVHGVVQVGNQVQAIVKTPNESAARYVRPGQRLEGGLVLVKRIEARGVQPVVVFEQDGIQVARAVGQEPDFPVNPFTIGARVSSLQSQSPPGPPMRAAVTTGPVGTPTPSMAPPQQPTPAAPRQGQTPDTPTVVQPTIVLPPAPPVR
ncbi:MAG: hypothetical protein Q6L54_06645 [Gloeomargarita sp. HHBFW_bins_205]